MNKRFARIGDILPAVLKSVGLDRKLKEREVLAAWPGVVGWPFISSAVAGAGTGSVPCAHRIVPLPSASGEQWIFSPSDRL